MYRAKKAWENQQNDTENRKNAIILRNISEKRLQINNKFVSLQRESKINSKIRNYKRYIIDKMSNLIKPEGYKALLDMRQTEMGIKMIKEFFQQNLSTELRLRRVTAPLFVLKGLGINDTWMEWSAL